MLLRNAIKIAYLKTADFVRRALSLSMACNPDPLKLEGGSLLELSPDPFSARGLPDTNESWDIVRLRTGLGRSIL